MTIESIVQEYEDRWGILNIERAEYKRFIEEQIRLESNKEETLDLTFLFSYIRGDRDIVDNSDLSKKRIENPEDLVLLSPSNISTYNTKERRYDNPELMETLKALNLRHNKEEERLNYVGAIIRVLEYDRINERFGGATYESHIDRWHNHREKKDMDLLKEYVMGRKPIFDKKGQSNTIKPENKTETLHLLSQTNVKSKGESGYLNPELGGLMRRFYNRKQISSEFLGYDEALSKIFEDPEVIGYIGKVGYRSHVCINWSENRGRPPKKR